MGHPALVLRSQRINRSRQKRVRRSRKSVQFRQFGYRERASGLDHEAVQEDDLNANLCCCAVLRNPYAATASCMMRAYGCCTTHQFCNPDMMICSSCNCNPERRGKNRKHRERPSNTGGKAAHIFTHLRCSRRGLVALLLLQELVFSRWKRHHVCAVGASSPRRIAAQRGARRSLPRGRTPQQAAWQAR